MTTDSQAMTQAAWDVLAERRRQVEAEGWSPEHDDEHRDGEMVIAAAAYARHATLGAVVRALFPPGVPPEGWPWGHNWWKPKDRRHDLVRAGALILAEIERLDRASEQGGAHG